MTLIGVTSELRDFWFLPQTRRNWFNCNPSFDELISLKYRESFDIFITIEPSILSEMYKSGTIDIVGTIILLDQVPRHCARSENRVQIDVVEKATRKAAELSKYLHSRNLLEHFSQDRLCFVLMPLRHTREMNDIDIVLGYVRDSSHAKTPTPVFKRFMKASFEQAGRMKNNSLVCARDTDFGVGKGTQSITINDFLEFEDVIDEECIQCKFYNRWYDIDTTLKFLVSTSLFKSFEERIAFLPRDSDVTISLSGGVDSMLVLLLTKALVEKNRFDNSGHSTRAREITVVSINYNNRTTSAKESEFVRKWCTMVGVKHCFIRSITELQREMFQVRDRDLYEAVTKSIRMDMYSLLGNPVLIGHNRDDVFENIVTNIKQGIHFDNLEGMDEDLQVLSNGVQILRPLLSISKDDIIKTAHEIGMPYLYNSTPTWSERGKIREHLILPIRNYSTDFEEGLHTIAKTTKTLMRQLERCVIDPFIDSCLLGEDGDFPSFSMPVSEDHLEFDTNMWKIIIHRMFDKLRSSCVKSQAHSQLCYSVSNKSIVLFADKLKTICCSEKASCKQKFILNSSFTACIKKDQAPDDHQSISVEVKPTIYV